MGKIVVHEFMTLDGVVDAPTWTFDFGFDPKMGGTIKTLTDRSRAILLGRTTYEMFGPLDLSLMACEPYENGATHLGYAPSPRTG
jgi:hypothetical protein